MVLLPMTLRLEAADSSGVQEYRIYEGSVEVRDVHSGEENDDVELVQEQLSDEWRRLSHDDLTEHVRRNTVVAQWLKHRLGWRRLLQACTHPDTLRDFGIAAIPADRHVA